MSRTAKLFRHGRNQAVCMPSEFHFEGKEVFIRQDPATGDIILSKRPDSWERFFALRDETAIPEDFMKKRRDLAHQKRQLF